MISLEHYKLATKFYRKKLKNGGVSIFVHESINFIGIDLQHRCKEQDTEICAIKMNLNKLNIIIIAIYRSPVGDFNYFLEKLDATLNQLHNIRMKFVICGDINVNYLDNCHNRQLDNVLSTYNLNGTVYFPTRTADDSATVIDNIFVD
jgi:exonuclease III